MPYKQKKKKVNVKDLKDQLKEHKKNKRLKKVDVELSMVREEDYHPNVIQLAKSRGKTLKEYTRYLANSTAYRNEEARKNIEENIKILKKKGYLKGLSFKKQHELALNLYKKKLLIKFRANQTREDYKKEP
jgi:hypothetical protein